MTAGNSTSFKPPYDANRLPLVLMQLPPRWPRSPHLPIPWLYLSGQVEHRSRLPFFVWTGRVRHGCCWF